MANRPAHASASSNPMALDYAPPRHNVLLLSCMDLRLCDEIVTFMNSDNLTNRYDHVILAGASLGVLQDTFSTWKATFFDHLRLAIDLHHIQDIYVIEHRCCGAYVAFQKKEYGDSRAEQEREEHDHAVNAFQFGDLVAEWCASQNDASGKPIRLGMHYFLMDLRGHIIRLSDPRTPVASKAEKKGKAESGSA